MDIYVCNGKEKQGRETKYLLSNIRNNRQEIVIGDKLKKAMADKKVDVMNLTLTSDGRLVEASKDKIIQMGGILKAPAEIKDKLSLLAPAALDQTEDIMDDIIKDCLDTYLKQYSKYAKIKSIDKHNNTFVIEFTLGLNSYVLCRYDKIIYGKIEPGVYKHDIYDIKKTAYGICFDIGIQVIGISNKRTSSKIGDGTILKASNMYNEKYIVLDVLDNQSYDVDLCDTDIVYLKNNLGRSILNYIGRELNKVCENNTDITNNTNLQEYIRYDEYKKDYLQTAGLMTALNLGGSIVFGSLIAALLVTNPEIIQQGLLSELLKSGTTSEILRATWACTGGISLLGGGITMEVMNRKEDFGYMVRTAKQDYKRIKEHIEQDKTPLIGKKKLK